MACPDFVHTVSSLTFSVGKNIHSGTIIKTKALKKLSAHLLRPHCVIITYCKSVPCWALCEVHGDKYGGILYLPVEMGFHMKDHIRAINKSCMWDVSVFWVIVPLKIFFLIRGFSNSRSSRPTLFILATALQARNDSPLLIYFNLGWRMQNYYFVCVHRFRCAPLSFK